MNLLDAPYAKLLRVTSIQELTEDAKLILRQLGLSTQEEIEKLHLAPLGDPLTLRIGGQRFSLRKEICKKIEVEECL